MKRTLQVIGVASAVMAAFLIGAFTKDNDKKDLERHVTVEANNIRAVEHLGGDPADGSYVMVDVYINNDTDEQVGFNLAGLTLDGAKIDTAKIAKVNDTETFFFIQQVDSNSFRKITLVYDVPAYGGEPVTVEDDFLGTDEGILRLEGEAITYTVLNDEKPEEKARR